MNIWRAVHRELTAAWRSLRYDLRRRTGRAAPEAVPTLVDASGDASTVVLPRIADTDGDFPEYEAYARRPRRVRTAVLVATLAATGAVATYLGVVNGLSALLPDDRSLPGALPGVHRDDPGPDTGQGPEHTGTRPDSAARPTPPAVPQQVVPTGDPDRSGEARPFDPDRPRTPEESGRRPDPTDTRTPPVPTPAPDPTPTGSPDPSASPSPTPSDSPTPSPSQSATPSENPTPSKSAPARAS